MTMFGTVGFTDTTNRMAGLLLEYNILPDYTSDQHDSLKFGLKAPDYPRQINIPFGHSEGSGLEYIAFDPFVAATNVETVVPDELVKLSDMAIPSSSEINGITLKPGYLVAIRISRTTPTNISGNSGYNEYRDPIGFLDLRWELDEIK
jgi:hypothetical protein